MYLLRSLQKAPPLLRFHSTTQDISSPQWKTQSPLMSPSRCFVFHIVQGSQEWGTWAPISFLFCDKTPWPKATQMNVCFGLQIQGFIPYCKKSMQELEKHLTRSQEQRKTKHRDPCLLDLLLTAGFPLHVYILDALSREWHHSQWVGAYCIH